MFTLKQKTNIRQRGLPQHGSVYDIINTILGLCMRSGPRAKSIYRYASPMRLAQLCMRVHVFKRESCPGCISLPLHVINDIPDRDQCRKATKGGNGYNRELWLACIYITVVDTCLCQLTKVFAGMSMVVKWTLAASHQMVNTAISHARTPPGRLNSRSIPDTLLLGNLPLLNWREREGKGEGGGGERGRTEGWWRKRGRDAGKGWWEVGTGKEKEIVVACTVNQSSLV